MSFFPELSISLPLLLLLIAVAFTAGFIDAIAGGGGLLTIPALMLSGIPPHMVLGTNKLCATFGSATASYTFYRRGYFQPRLWRPGLLTTATGAALGAILAQKMPAEWLNQFLPVVVFLCGLYMLFSKIPERSEEQSQQIGQKRQVPQGLLLGFYDGVAGPGTGAFWTISGLLLYPLDLLRTTGVARNMNFVSNGMALAMFIVGGQVMWSLGIAMGLALMLGAVAGARLAIGGGSKLIRPLFILMVMALTIKLAWQHWFTGT